MVYVKLYEILVEQSGGMPGAIINGLLSQGFSILEYLSQGLLKKDSFYAERQSHVESEQADCMAPTRIGVAARKDGVCGKDGMYGK